MNMREIDKRKHAACAIACALILAIFILISGCLQEKSATRATNEQVPQNRVQTQPTTIIGVISIELDMLSSKDWNRLAVQLGRPRATTLLWFHLKKTIGFEPIVIFGNPDKLNTSIGIPVSIAGNSSLPMVKIKDADFYIIDPMTPVVVDQLEYSYVFTDPGSVPPGYFNSFRLNTDDVAIVEQWLKETGAPLYYTDFPGK